MKAKEKLISLERAARLLIGAWDDGEFTEGGDPEAHVELLRQALPDSSATQAEVKRG